MPLRLKPGIPTIVGLLVAFGDAGFLVHVMGHGCPVWHAGSGWGM